MECIIVDDCGTDNSMVVVERVLANYIGSILFKVLHHDHNRGLSAARNTGMDEATGDYLFFLDSDDELTDDCIEKLTSIGINDANIEIIHGSAKSYPPQKPDYCDREIKVTHAINNNLVRLCYFKNSQFIHSAWNKLFKSSFVSQQGLRFCEDLLLEDVLWTFYLMKSTKNVWFVPDVTYYYKIRPNSIITGTDKRKLNENYNRLLHEILCHLTPHYEKEELSFYLKILPFLHINWPLFQFCCKKSWYYKNYSCCKIAAISFISGSELGRMTIQLIWKLKHLIF